MHGEVFGTVRYKQWGYDSFCHHCPVWLLFVFSLQTFFPFISLFAVPWPSHLSTSVFPGAGWGASYRSLCLSLHPYTDDLHLCFFQLPMVLASLIPCILLPPGHLHVVVPCSFQSDVISYSPKSSLFPSSCPCEWSIPPPPVTQVRSPSSGPVVTMFLTS